MSRFPHLAQMMLLCVLQDINATIKVILIMYVLLGIILSMEDASSVILAMDVFKQVRKMQPAQVLEHFLLLETQSVD